MFYDYFTLLFLLIFFFSLFICFLSTLLSCFMFANYFSLSFSYAFDFSYLFYAETFVVCVAERESETKEDRKKQCEMTMSNRKELKNQLPVEKMCFWNNIHWAKRRNGNEFVGSLQHIFHRLSSLSSICCANTQTHMRVCAHLNFPMDMTKSFIRFNLVFFLLFQHRFGCYFPLADGITYAYQTHIFHLNDNRWLFSFCSLFFFHFQCCFEELFKSYHVDERCQQFSWHEMRVRLQILFRECVCLCVCV